MFEAKDLAQPQSAATADNTSSRLSTFVIDALKDNFRPYQKPDFDRLNNLTNPVIEFGARGAAAVGGALDDSSEGGKGGGGGGGRKGPSDRGCALPSSPGLAGCGRPEFKEPSEKLENPALKNGLTQDALDRMETELRLYALTPKDDSTFSTLSRDLNHAFVSGDLKDFTDVLNKADHRKMKDDLVNALDRRLQKLEMGESGETEMFGFAGVIDFYTEDTGKSNALQIDLNTNKSQAVDADIKSEHFENGDIITMAPGQLIDMDPAELFRSLVNGEVTSIASNDEPLAMLKSAK